MTRCICARLFLVVTLCIGAACGSHDHVDCTSGQCSDGDPDGSDPVVVQPGGDPGGDQGGDTVVTPLDTDSDGTPDATDCAPTDAKHWSDCGHCTDADADGRGVGCDLGSDCDDTNADSWAHCVPCYDYDHDGYFTGCDGYNVKLGPDCDDHHPLSHPGAVDFPDNGIYEDCAAPEPHATDGNGVYVDLAAPGCGVNETGSIDAPFCTLAAAITAAPVGSSIFVASGTYAAPQNISSLRIFGGYHSDWTRSFLQSDTVLTNDVEFFGISVDDVLMQDLTVHHTNDCNNCVALYVTGGALHLADVTVEMDNTQSVCTTIYAPSGDLTLMHTTISGAGCVDHVGMDCSGKTIVWSSTIQTGLSQNTTQDPLGFFNNGDAVVGESSIRGDGNGPEVVRHFGTSLSVLASTIIGAGPNLAVGFNIDGANFVAENNFVMVNANASAFGFDLSSGTAALLQNDIVVDGYEVTAFQIHATDAITLVNNVIETNAGDAAVTVRQNNGGTDLTLTSNDIQGNGTASTCMVVDTTDTCTAAAVFDLNGCAWSGCTSASGNIASTCNIGGSGVLPAADPCIDAGTDVSALIQFPIDFQSTPRPIDGDAVPGAAWDIGRFEYSP